MQLVICAAILLVSFFIYYLFGKAVCLRYHWDLIVPEIVCLGFFLYFGAFQVIALIMIFTQQKLHVLGFTWGIILLLLAAMSIDVIYKERKENRAAQAEPAGTEKWEGLFLAALIAAIVCECLTGLLLQRSIGWDFAYYIGNMSTSVATDTMYVYDGSSGMKLSHLELRYALSGFYMNTAWIAQLVHVPAILVQKYVVGVADILLADAALYSFASEVFGRNKKKSALLVTIVIVMTVFWDVYDTSAQFLLLRGYEAKAYCANVVLPMTAYLLYRIWKRDDRMQNWAELFLVAFASVAVSMSSVMLVPALIVLMMLAHICVTKRWDWTLIRRTLYCLLPNVCYLLIYFAGAQGWLVVAVH